jgi:hypothetical protein
MGSLSECLRREKDVGDGEGGRGREKWVRVN